MNRWFLFHAAEFALVLILPLFFEITSTFKQQGGCYFPERWEGTWFQSGIRQPVIIEGPRLSSKGRCLASEGDKFLVVDDKRACYRCVVIHEKHANVLQYKETFCYGRESLPTLCSYITGDALLYSMFRENAASVPCPFRGPFTFTYNRGHGECRYPVSSIDSCTEDSRLLLSYQACPDVGGTESAVEELECLAIWKEGSSRYLVGKVHHSHATSNEDRFRCFVYEKASSESLDDDVDYRVAQSGDATCNGLFSATEGSRTMTLKRAPSLNRCRFPSWLTNYNSWHTLDYSATYSFHHRNSTLKITNSSWPEMKVVCSQLKYSSRDESSVVVLAHFTTGCQSGFICMSFNRRDLHVMEVQIGDNTKSPENACSPEKFNKTSRSFVTLVTSSPDTRACPYMGKFEVNNLIRSERSTRSNKQYHHLDALYSDKTYYINKLTKTMHLSENHHSRRMKRVDQENQDCDSQGFTSLVIGCNSLDTMEFRTQCSDTGSTAYACHGRWEENGTNYLITTSISRAAHSSRRYCFIYKESGPDLVLFSSSADNCDRIIRPGITGELVFNVTSTGKCIDVGNASKMKSSNYLLLGMMYGLYNIINIINVHR